MAYPNSERPYVLGASETLQKTDILIACVLRLKIQQYSKTFCRVVATTGVGKTTVSPSASQLSSLTLLIDAVHQ